jgi:two-component sensor histidine kinase
MKDYGRAKEYAHKMLAVCEELKAPHRMVNAYRQLTRITKRMKEYDSALYYKELNVWIADSLSNVEKSGQIAEMQEKYEAKEKESQISLLSESNKTQLQRIWILGGAALLLAVLAGAFVWQNRRLTMQKKKIASQSERLGWMMKELHHRVKNNLQIVSSLLSLQTYRLKDEESISAIKESQLRVQAMSLIHQRLYQVQDVSMVNFKLYLDDLVETLMKAYGYGPDDFDLSVNIDNELLDVDTVMPMGLLVNEIITNSFKYAYKDVSRPLLTINMKSEEQQLQLTIADNGPGMNATGANNIKPGFGKKLIDALTKQLRANYTVSSTQGTVYSFTIPYSNEKAA